MSLSVLQRGTSAHVRRDPFPHLVIENALPDELVDALIDGYPPLDKLGVDPHRNNKRWSCPASRVAATPDISETWKQVIAWHSSPAFFRETVELLGEDIVRLYPERFPSLDRLRTGTAGIRSADSFEDHDFLIDAQICGNTPVRERSSVKTTHVDSPRKLFAGLFYLRSPGDDSAGGDLTIVRCRPGLSRRQFRRRFDSVYLKEDRIETVATVRYAANTLVMFVNSLDSLHGVTEREPTSHPRLFMNLVCEVQEPLFEVPQTWEKQLSRMVKRTKRRAAGALGLQTDDDPESKSEYA